MNTEKKEVYVQPVLVKHELLRDITATKSGYYHDRNFSVRRCSASSGQSTSRARGWPVRKNRPACLLNLRTGARDESPVEGQHDDDRGRKAYDRVSVFPLRNFGEICHGVAPVGRTGE